jgi:Rrf2 family protein
MKLSRTIVYGIHAVVRLASGKPDVPVPCSQLARDGQLPERFLVQILRCLVNHGVLRSTCGVAGGYSLSRPAEEITLRDIVESFENPLQIQLPALDCMPDEVRARVLDCLNATVHAARVELQKETVADLVAANVKLMNGKGSRSAAASNSGMAFIRINGFDTSAGSIR